MFHVKRIDQNTESDQKVKKIISCLLDKNSFSIETNSYNFIKYTILKLNRANKLFIVGDIAYSLSKDVSILTNKECRYIEEINQNIYPNILNPGMIKEKIKIIVWHLHNLICYYSNNGRLRLLCHISKRVAKLLNNRILCMNVTGYKKS